MSTYPAAGVGSKVYAGANLVGNIDTWLVKPKGASKDTTPFGAADAWGQTTGTIKDWTAEWDGQFDPSDAGQTSMVNDLHGIFTIKMYVDGTYYFTGQARYDGGQFQSKATDVVTVKYMWTGIGSLTLTS